MTMLGLSPERLESKDMNLSHDVRAEAHEQIVPLLEAGKRKAANDIARSYAGGDWRDLIEEASLIAGL